MFESENEMEREIAMPAGTSYPSAAEKARAKARRYMIEDFAIVAVILLAIVAAFWVAGCGDRKPAGSSSSACPAELAGNSAEWMADGDDEQCAELAGVLNEGLDVSGGDDGCGGEVDIRTRGGECVATAASECDGIALELDCAVRSSGAADCAAIVRSAELEAGSCSFTLLIR